MSVLQSGITKSLAEDYTIDQSLRFDDGDSAYLSRTPSVGGNRRIFTLSCWVKRGSLGSANNRIYGNRLDADNTSWMYFTSADELQFYSGDTANGEGTISIITRGKFRDPSAWYHVVFGVDITDSGSEVYIWVNGEIQATDRTVSSFSADHVTRINHTVEQDLGRQGPDSAGQYYDGYLAEVYFIDGTRYAGTDFGETDDTTNQWKPIDASGLTFGTNGFYQKYAATELANSFFDSSESGRHTVTANGNVHTDTAVKKIGTASAQFDGTTDYLSIPSTADFKIGTGDFTMEGWFYHTTTGVTENIFDLRNGSTGFKLDIDTSNYAGFYSEGTTSYLVNTTAISSDAWHHVAVQRKSSYMYIYLDGTLDDSAIHGTDYTSNLPMIIGARYNAPSGDQEWTGYMDEIRFTNIARYAGSFTAPTEAFTNDINTMLLLHCDGSNDGTSFPDNSSHTVTSVDIVNTKAFGNVSIARDTYTSAGSTTWIAPIGVTSVDYLVVGGGGSGGGGTDAPYAGGGGGGAGGFRTGTLSVTPGTSYTVTVGAGGAAQAGTASQGNDGADSVFSSITSDGGGGGGGGTGAGGADDGKDGGSGGGASRSSSPAEQGIGGTGTTDQGNDGGDGDPTPGSNHDGAGGGGGASAAGETAANLGGTGSGGDGGAGTASSITGSSVTYAGGGGGGGGNASSVGVAGAGGAGGGGAGGDNSAAAGTAGTANTGGGGGGGGYINGDGAAGGSGIVIISYTRIVPGSSSMYFSGATSGFADGDYLQLAASDQWAFGTGEWTLEGWFYNTSDANNSCLVWSQRNDSGLAALDNTMQDWAAPVSGDTTVKWQYQQPSVGNVNVTHQSTYPKDSWHHIAHVRSGDTVTVYLDGVASTSTFDATGLSMGLDRVAVIGTQDSARSYCFEGYVDEIRISDTARYTGAFTPSTTQFTTDSNTLLLIHSDWDGGLGADSSGNYNTFTATNLVATDKMGDTPNNNFCTWNPALRYLYSYLAEGNLQSVGNDACCGANMGPTMCPPPTGKWYWEMTATTIAGGDWPMVGTIGYEVWDEIGTWQANDGRPGEDSGGWRITKTGDYETAGGGVSSGGQAFAADDILQIALDHDNGALYYGINNVWYTPTAVGGDPTSGASKTGAVMTWTAGADRFLPAIQNYNTGVLIANFGQDSSFAGNQTAQGNQDANEIGDFYYTPPTDYLALCSSNLPDPEIALPGEHYNTVIWTGDDANPRTITGVGFQGDLTWQRRRNAVADWRQYDVVRAGGYSPGTSNPGITSNSDAASWTVTTTGTLSAWTSDGFTLSGSSSTTDINNSAGTYASWGWLANGSGSLNEVGDIDSTVSVNSTAGFSLVKFTGNKTASQTVGHGLSETPTFGIFKSMGTGQSWRAYWSTIGATNYGYLDRDAAFVSSAGTWSPTSSVFTVDDSDAINGTGVIIIAYVYHEVEGYSKFGRYEGNGNANATFVYTGFRPAFLMIKNVDATAGWPIHDSARMPYNGDTASLLVDATDAEATGTGSAYMVDLYSNGFKPVGNGSGSNSGSITYVYAAFAEFPFKTTNAR